jgi:CheY-like chemotaxis protein
MLQKLYQMTIESWKLPINLRIVSDGFEGLLLVGQQTPDILIADLMMPGMDGFEMIRRLRMMPDLSAWTSSWSAPSTPTKFASAASRQTSRYLANRSRFTKSRASCSAACRPGNELGGKKAQPAQRSHQA